VNIRTAGDAIFPTQALFPEKAGTLILALRNHKTVWKPYWQGWIV